MTTVTGTLKDASGTAVAGSAQNFVRFELLYTGYNQPHITGTTQIVPSKLDVQPDSSGNLSTNLYGNDIITCGTVTGGTRWQVTYFVGGFAGNSAIYNITGGTWDLTSALPDNALPPPTPPAAVDATYLRLDGGNSPVTGTVAFTAGINTKKLSNIRFADQYAGADLGAKINAADTDLGATAGEIWVSRLAGTSIDTAVSLSANHVLRFVQLGQYDVSAIITMAANSTIIGPQNSFAANTTPLLVLKMANTVNLASMITVNGAYCSLAGIELDGNKSNNASGGVGILVNVNCTRLDLSHVTIGHCKSHGISISSTGTTNNSGSPKLSHVNCYENDGSGLYSLNTADGFVSNCEFETNGQYGIELSDSPTWRILHNDFGQNTLDGLYIHGTFAGLEANRNIIIGNQFGNQYQNDIRIVGYNSGNTSFGNVIVGNCFFGSGYRTPANTYNCLALVDGGMNVISSNYFHASASASNTEQYAISQTETGGGRALANQASGNQFDITDRSWGTAAFLDSTANGTLGLQVPVRGGSTSSLDLFDITAGASTPHKFFRVSSGALHILDSTFANVILGLLNDGSLQIGPANKTTFDATGKITKYGAIATVSNGVPAEYAVVDLTDQSAAVATTTLYAVPASGAGQYRLIWNAKVTTVDAVSSTLGALTIVYTDPDGVAQTITAGALTEAGAVATTATGNVTTTALLGLPVLLNCKASTNITYAMAYASNTPGTMKFNLHIALEKL